MHSSQEKIHAAFQRALKQGERRRLEIFRFLQAVIHNKEIEKRTVLAKQGKSPEPLTEDEVIEVLISEVKKRKEAIRLYEEGRRPELAAKEKEEIALLEEFLPQALSPEELSVAVRDALAKTGAHGKDDFGKVMVYLRGLLKGRADFSEVSILVRQALERTS